MSSVRKRSANVASAAGFCLCESVTTATLFYLCESATTATLFYLCESATTATTKRLAGTEINSLFCRTAFTFVIHKIYKSLRYR
ncbi:hypothetical protein [Lysinibacillus xylanilyticus]|uniref:hypothetical protein n=1 Tax=Lysinibacillus xylanilyticus TaxID=582475 RepID=UPI00083C9B48|nr:hypothetical protein [Lysinibacillus xylanilyticus]